MLTSLFDQNRSSWDTRLIANGLAFFERSARGDAVTCYHVEAAIAAAHASTSSAEATDWTLIVELYDRLMAMAPSPVVSLSRAIAIAQRDGPDRGLEELRGIPNRERLARYPFYPAALGELELRQGNVAIARTHFAAALALARNEAERVFLEQRLR